MISFEGARLLSYEHDHIFLADNFRYAVRKSLSVEGTIYSLDNTDGVTPVWQGISGLVQSATDYDSVIINGYNLGSARVENISFADGVDVRKKDYTVSLTVFESGNLFNMTGRYYDGLDVNNPQSPIFLIQNLSESFSFDLNENNEGQVDQSIDIQFISGGATGSSANPLKMAQLFASGLFNATSVSNIINDEHSGLYDSARKRYFTESYNQISNQCSFSCTSKLLNTSEIYYLTYSHGVTTDDKGITTVIEDGTILGLYTPLSGSANSGFLDAIDNSFLRSSGAFSRYKPSNAYDLSDTRLSLEKKVNNFAGTIDYTVSYSNNPNLFDSYTWEYTQQIDKLEGCIYNVSENGTIKGMATDCDSSNLYNHAQSGYQIIKTGIYARSYGVYNSGTNLTKSLTLISKSESQSRLNGTVEYDYLYTDDVNQGVSGFKSVEYTVDDTAPVALIAKFMVPGVKEIVQPSYNSTLGNRAMSLHIKGGKDQTIFDYRQFAQVKFNQFIPTGGDVFIKECNYSYSPTNHDFTAQLSWTFFGWRDFDSIYL